jgi:hypothetical protein
MSIMADCIYASRLRRLLYVFSGNGGAEFSKKNQSAINMNEQDDSTPGIQAASEVNGLPDETE